MEVVRDAGVTRAGAGARGRRGEAQEGGREGGRVRQSPATGAGASSSDARQRPSHCRAQPACPQPLENNLTRLGLAIT